jgi:hypothetical protein
MRDWIYVGLAWAALVDVVVADLILVLRYLV